MYDAITDVPGVMVGHAQDYDAMTGVTAILTEAGAVGGIDIRGTAAGTRQADSLSALHIAGVVHAVTLAGGSAWGLSASGGVMRYLEQKGIGLDVFYAKVPIVPAAIIFDLGIGDAKVRPDEAMGYAAAAAAASGPVAQGTVGAGTGATVGKLYGVANAMKGGVGTAAESLGEIIAGALVVVNAFGDILDAKDCRVIAGARDPHDGQKLALSTERIRNGEDRFAPSGQNTTLAVLATNAVLDKREAIKIAQMLQSSLAKVISPIHSTFDGDVAIVLSVGGTKRIGMNTLAMMGQEAIIRAVTNAITEADGRTFVPSYSDMRDKR
jgi:L-aminopeptidase/D-esterase-like protein